MHPWIWVRAECLSHCSRSPPSSPAAPAALLAVMALALTLTLRLGGRSPPQMTSGVVPPGQGLWITVFHIGGALHSQAPKGAMDRGPQPHRGGGGGRGFCTGNIPRLSRKMKGEIPHRVNLDCSGRNGILALRSPKDTQFSKAASNNSSASELPKN